MKTSALMIKEALLCGLGMIVDISGSYYTQARPPRRSDAEQLAISWQRVGSNLSSVIEGERPAIEAEAARQLQLNLGP